MSSVFRHIGVIIFKRELDEHEKERREKDRLETMKRLRPIDDILMRFIFKEKQLSQLVIRIVTQKSDIVIRDTETQADVRNPGSVSIVPDVLSADTMNCLYNLEFQRKSRDAGIRRMNYHLASFIIADAGISEPFRNCSEFYVIFITEKDTCGGGYPVSLIKSVDVTTGMHIDENCHRIYVNGQYKGDDDFGRLIHDIMCPDPDEMFFPEFAQTVRKFKNTETEEGKMVCRAVEEYGERIEQAMKQRITEEVTEEVTERVTEEVTERVTEEVTAENRLDAIRNVMSGLNYSEDQAMDLLKIPDNERHRYIELLNCPADP